jgi:hypothetical protein
VLQVRLIATSWQTIISWRMPTMWSIIRAMSW